MLADAPLAATHLLQATEVETKEVTPGAEYRTKGLAPRKNNNYEDESVVLQYLYRTRDRARRTYEVGGWIGGSVAVHGGGAPSIVPSWVVHAAVLPRAGSGRPYSLCGAVWWRW